MGLVGLMVGKGNFEGRVWVEQHFLTWNRVRFVPLTPCPFSFTFHFLLLHMIRFTQGVLRGFAVWSIKYTRAGQAHSYSIQGIRNRGVYFSFFLRFEYVGTGCSSSSSFFVLDLFAGLFIDIPLLSLVRSLFFWSVFSFLHFVFFSSRICTYFHTSPALRSSCQFST